MNLMDILIKMILYIIHLLTILNMVPQMDYLVVRLLVAIGIMVQIVDLVLCFVTIFLLMQLAISVLVGVFMLFMSSKSRVAYFTYPNTFKL